MTAKCVSNRPTTKLTNKYIVLVSVLVNTTSAMSYEPPPTPTELPTNIVETLEKSSPQVLREVARYANELAAYREREARLDEVAEDDIEERPEDLPDDVPTRATITIKEINENRYYYWQWRDGDRVKSKYKGPVDVDE